MFVLRGEHVQGESQGILGFPALSQIDRRLEPTNRLLPVSFAVLGRYTRTTVSSRDCVYRLPIIGISNDLMNASNYYINIQLVKFFSPCFNLTVPTSTKVFLCGL